MDKTDTSTHTAHARNGHVDCGHVPVKVTATTIATSKAMVTASRNFQKLNQERTMITATTRPSP